MIRSKYRSLDNFLLPSLSNPLLNFQHCCLQSLTSSHGVDCTYSRSKWQWPASSMVEESDEDQRGGC